MIFFEPFGHNIIRMGKTVAEQEYAHVVRHGRRLLLLGIPPKLIFRLLRKEKLYIIYIYIQINIWGPTREATN